MSKTVRGENKKNIVKYYNNLRNAKKNSANCVIVIYDKKKEEVKNKNYKY